MANGWPIGHTWEGCMHNWHILPMTCIVWYHPSSYRTTRQHYTPSLTDPPCTHLFAMHPFPCPPFSEPSNLFYLPIA